MSAASQILARRMRLPRAQTHDVVCEDDLRVPMDDGEVLLADRWVARTSRHRPQPTVLVRSPYGRKQLFGVLFGRLFAERGLQVVIQSTRGTFGSGGAFSPFDERADGIATLRWVRAQPWHEGGIGMLGPSYLGIVQWAVADEDLASLSIQFSASQFYGQTYAGGSLSLETSASWLVLVAAQEHRFALFAISRALRRLAELLRSHELADLDQLATGTAVDWYREAMLNPRREDPYWVSRDFTATVSEVRAPVQLIGGWYDIFLPWLLDDHAALVRAGKRVQLEIGPWTHTAPGGMRAGIREGLAWLRAGLLGDERLVRRAAVSLFVTGEPTGSGWRAFEAWPPPGYGKLRLWLGGEGRLGSETPDAGGADGYRYDPEDPTPSVGGPVLLGRQPVLDNRALEARPDVLTYTTEPLPATLEAIGPVRAELWVRADSPYFDVFARVCDVDHTGASWNVCDALARVAPGVFEPSPDGAFRVPIELWPTAHRFAAGHRIRLQVSSGAHPRYARNPGTGEDPLTARAMRAVQIEVLRGEDHPSVLVLPAQG